MTAALAGCANAPGTGPLVPEENRAQWATACADWDEWDKPAPPYRIHGQTYYVGTCGISAILIVGQSGLVLMDSGTEPGSRVVEANIARLGYSISNVKALLVSHEHFDHVGGMARLQRLSGATVHAGQGAVNVLRTGTDDPRDPQAGLHDPMEPVAGLIEAAEDGGTIAVSGIRVTAIATPGHTIGAISWQWQSCEGSQCRTIVYADSLTPVSSDDYRFVDHPEYVAMFRRGIARLAETPCDILITPHPSASRMRAKAAGDAPWVDTGGCKDYAAQASARLDARLAREAKLPDGK
ncbi:subclass B3 metallo-beta-lactamase [Leptolyngbya sp. 15MV]|nr:subclass B3 metallo-beta-lactamase [Leptolyngbya sp. 15MV]